MARCLHAAGAILLGLMTAQIIATVQVYSSNADLFRTLALIRDTGYLSVPNHRIMPRLQEFNPAFFGGLFFTLSTGAGLSVISLSAAWAWDRLLRRKGIFMIGYLLLWGGSLWLLNHRGLAPMASMYFLLIPPLVFVVAPRSLPTQDRQGILRSGLVHLVPIGLLALLWAFQTDSRLFVDVRDHLLLSNPLETKINDFYYEYNLYPAEVLKPLQQKLLKTADLEGVPQRPVARALERTLLNYDYCNVGGGEVVDLKIEQRGNDLILGHRGRTALKTTLQEFLSRPASVLRDFSRKADTYAVFRRFTFYSLLIGLPLTLYLVLHALFCLPLRLFLGPRTSMVLASFLCFFVGVAFLVLLQHLRPVKMGSDDLEEALGSPNWHTRVAALKVVEQERFEVSEFRSYQDLVTSPLIPERYWLVRALGVSRRSATYKDLLVFLDDPHPNVASMAFYALGERGEKQAIEVIIRTMETSADWYNQWYAYKALRKLGWKQSASNSKS